MDRRKAKTRRAVQEALYALLERKRYSQITVQDILDEADIGRSTFYAHYQGKESLLAQIVDDICVHAAAPAAPETAHDFTNRTDPASVVEHVLRHVQEREHGIRALMSSEAIGMFERYLRESLARQADAALPRRPSGAAGTVERDLLVNHIAGSLVELVLWWARDGFAADPRRLAESYVALVSPIFA